MESDSLQGLWDKEKLKWWYKLASMPGALETCLEYPPRGHQRKSRNKVVNHLLYYH